MYSDSSIMQRLEDEGYDYQIIGPLNYDPDRVEEDWEALVNVPEPLTDEGVHCIAPAVISITNLTLPSIAYEKMKPELRYILRSRRSTICDIRGEETVGWPSEDEEDSEQEEEEDDDSFI